MAESQPTVFLSYRRQVSSFIARAVFQHLRQNQYDVFMDVESIDSGQFEKIILAQIAARAHFLVILTPGTLERCQEPGDWLKREIEYAMDLGRNVIPILVNDFRFDDNARTHLTGKLSALLRYNGLTLPHEYFDAAMERLCTRFLNQPAQGSIKPSPRQDAPIVQAKIEEVISQSPPTEQELSAEDYFNRGYALNDDSPEQIAYFTKAIQLNPRYWAAYYNRGVIRGKQGDYAGAIADYSQAIALKPDFAEAYNNRGAFRDKQGDQAGAITDYSQAIALKPDYVKAYNNRGLIRSAQGDQAGAIADYDQVIALKPDNADAYDSRGLARHSQGDPTGAIADYDQAIALKPDNIDVYLNRGLARHSQGDLTGAIADYEYYLTLGGGRRDGDQQKVEELLRELRAQLRP